MLAAIIIATIMASIALVLSGLALLLALGAQVNLNKHKEAEASDGATKRLSNKPSPTHN